MKERLQCVGKTVILFANLILLALWFAGFAAAYVPPKQIWWFQLIAIALPYVTVGVLVSSLLLLALRWWSWFALHALVLLLAGGRFIPFTSLTHSADAQPDDLTLMSFNMRFGYGGPSHEEVGKQLFALVQQEDLNAVALQEAWMGFREAPHPVPSRYIAPLIDSLGFKSAKGNPEPWNYTEQPFLVKATPLSQKNIFFDVDGMPSIATVRAEFMWHSQKVVLYNIHLRTYGLQKPWHEEQPSYLSPAFWKPYLVQFKQAFLWRAQEATALRALIEAEKHPVIIIGDFNETRHNWSYNYLREGFKDAFQAAGSGWGLTYHSKRPFTRIDHILVDEHWDVVSAHVVKTELSDHRPVVARLRLGP